MNNWLTDAEDGNWVSDKDVESPVTLTLSADQPVYDNGVLKVNISWSAGESSNSCSARLEICSHVF